MSVHQRLTSETEAADFKGQLRSAIDHLDHVLPGQAPIKDFVHHNTLHGYQALDFDDALEAAWRATGAWGYLPEDAFRAFRRTGRITDEDLSAVLSEDSGLEASEVLARFGRSAVTRGDVYKISLVYGVEPLTPPQLDWQVEEFDALHRFQPDLPEAVRHTLLSAGGEEADVVGELWKASLEKFGLSYSRYHPEDFADLSVEFAETMAERIYAEAGSAGGRSFIHERMRSHARGELNRMLEDVGRSATLRTLLLALTGRDLLESVQPVLIRLCAAHLDEGLAAWHAADRQRGFYASFRTACPYDLTWELSDLPDWGTRIGELPEDPMDCVIRQLQGMGIPDERWAGYVERVALEIPGWAGMFNWRTHHGGYHANGESRVSLVDFLAVRLFLDRLWADQICRTAWGLDADLGALGRHLGHRLSEFVVRRALYKGDLPEYLAVDARRLLEESVSPGAEAWRELANMIWTWEQSPAAERPQGHTLYRSVWRLFRLCQHLGVPSDQLREFSLAETEALLRALDELRRGRRSSLWLSAYERHYREAIFNALRENHGRGPWADRERRPAAQVVCCMDDREEGFRRHLEEVNPRIETLGAAGFFGVAMNWRGLDDTAVTPLCPVVVTPAHEIHEVPRPGAEEQKSEHDRRRRIKGWFGNLIHQEVRRNLISSHLLIDLLAPGALLALLGKVFLPRLQHRVVETADRGFVTPVATRVMADSAEGDRPATPERPRLGFTDSEQADRVAGLLRTIGLTSGLAPLVVLFGHGSSSENNPHMAAYDCGACSGRHGGPNARVYAAMANRPEIRALVAERGIDIPEDTWFLGGEHNTCDERLDWYDLDEMPERFRPAFDALRRELEEACALSAHERCRRLASAPRRPSPRQALAHVIGRAVDFSQARPELGHATNAAAFIGRRSMSRGVFFDRRVFLISYDPTQDPDGKILEAILLAAGPVGAGINLEYYFSTVNNEQLGCGSKILHNVTGLFAVMQGASSDLRTGLPKQMIEIHEAMRLQIVVESTVEILTEIYQRQAILRELIGNRWVHLSAKHPETGEISVFDPAKGFQTWRGREESLSVVERSTDWYAGHTDPLPPALVRKSVEMQEAEHV